MASQYQVVAIQLHNMIMAGDISAGSRLVETEFAKRLGVSRTPLRLALAELEKEGLLERLPTRGYRVRVFTAEEVFNAMDVRGCLEGMAARLAAEKRVDTATQGILSALLQEGDRFTNRDAANDLFFWSDFNRRFHNSIVAAAGNGSLSAAIRFNERAPLADGGLITLGEGQADLTVEWVRRAHEDHREIADAILRGEGTRAEFLMRHHAFRSRENRRQVLLRAQHK